MYAELLRCLRVRLSPRFHPPPWAPFRSHRRSPGSDLTKAIPEMGDMYGIWIAQARFRGVSTLKRRLNPPTASMAAGTQPQLATPARPGAVLKRRDRLRAIYGLGIPPRGEVEDETPLTAAHARTALLDERGFPRSLSRRERPPYRRRVVVHDLQDEKKWRQWFYL
jgi:hypothetical protein